MKKRIACFFLKRILVILFSTLVLATAEAAGPLWTIIPAPGSNPTQTIEQDETISIQYLVQNNSLKPKSLKIQSIQGVSQTTPCDLAPRGQNGSSCTLDLSLTGSELPKTGIHNGPILCLDGNRNQCYQPSQANRLNITVNVTPPPPNVAILVITNPSLILFPAYPALTPITKTLTITNTSTTITATNVAATLPQDWSDVTQNASACLSIAPGGSCQLTFTPSTSSHGSITAPVSGTNTNTVNTNLAVNYPWVTNLGVSSIIPDLAHNLIYISGNFTYLGPNTGSGAPIDRTTGLILPNFPRVNGIINTTISDGNGGWYIGGTFTSIDGAAWNRIAHILADYTIDPNFNANPNNDVNTLVLSGNVLYIGGDFTNVGGQPRNYIATLDSTTGLATAWSPNADNSVNIIVLNGNTVYAGGGFSSIGGQTRNHIAALDRTTGFATAWSSNANGTVVSAIAINGNIVYAGGDFTNIGGQTRNRIAALDGTTGLATAWDPNSNAPVNALVFNNNLIYAAGTFSIVNGQTRNRLVAIDIGTGIPTAWNPNLTGTPNTLASSAGTIYVGGTFSTIGTVPTRGFAILTE